MQNSQRGFRVRAFIWPKTRIRAAVAECQLRVMHDWPEPGQATAMSVVPPKAAVKSGQQRERLLIRFDSRQT
jgi:hypothetical protein